MKLALALLAFAASLNTAAAQSTPPAGTKEGGATIETQVGQTPATDNQGRPMNRSTGASTGTDRMSSGSQSGTMHSGSGTMHHDGMKVKAGRNKMKAKAKPMRSGSM